MINRKLILVFSKRIFLLWTGTCLGILLSHQVAAQEVREFYNGARMMAMGGTSIAVANDETALLSNPAALGKLRDAYGTLIDPELDVSTNLSSIYKGKAFTQLWDLEEVKTAVDNSRGTRYHARANLFPSFVVRNFGIGVYGRYSLDAVMNADGTAMETVYFDDAAILLGVNLRLFEGRLKFGVVGRGVNRIEINKSIDPTGALDKQTHASEGVGIGVDAGVILTGPWYLLPTISAVVRDVGSTNFESGSGLRMQTTTRPTKVEQDIDVGIAFFPIHSNRVRSSFTVEYHKIKEAAEATNKSRYYHVGYELNLSDLFFFRAGMNQQYWTGGLEFASEHMQFQFSSYGEDVGVDGSPEEDRRYMFKFAFRF